MLDDLNRQEIDPNTDPSPDSMAPLPVGPQRILVEEIQAIFDRVGTPSSRGECRHCNGEGRVLKLNVMQPCPNCRPDSVDRYGFRTKDGLILTWELFEQIVPNKGFMAHRNRNECILIMPPQSGKTLFLRTMYNRMLGAHRFKKFIYMATESEILEKIRNGERSELIKIAGIARAVLIDNFASPNNWKMFPEIKEAYLDFIDTLWERRELNFYAVGCADYRTVINDERWNWRLKELVKNQIITEKGR